MKFQRFTLFLLLSVGAGLLAAYIALQFLPQQGGAATSSQSLPTVYRATQSAIGPASYSEAVSQATPAVVNIYTAKITVQRRRSLFNDPFFQRFFGERFSSPPRKRLQTSLGSGVIVSQDGYIMTNHHVVEGADEIKVVLADGRTIEVRVVGSDPDTDLALLRTEVKELPTITLGSSEKLQVGDVVLAIGNPFGVGQTVTMGIVGATGRNQLGINTFEDFIQTDAAINPGNSGGALINAAGELVGINTAIFSKTGGSHGIGFAIPVDLASTVMTQLLTRGKVVRGWLGMAGQDVTPELAESFGLKPIQGVLITGLLERGAADRAGVMPGDIITHINDESVDASSILNIVAKLNPGTVAVIKGWRGDKEIELQAVVEERPDNASAN